LLVPVLVAYVLSFLFVAYRRRLGGARRVSVAA